MKWNSFPHPLRVVFAFLLFSASASAGLTPNLELESAAARGDTARIRELVSQGADVNSVEFYSPLSRAAQYGQTESAKVLVELGAEVNQPDGYATRPIQWAIRNRKEGMTLLLHQLGADLNLKYHNSLLSEALQAIQDHGSKEQLALQRRTVAWLFQAGFDIDRHPEQKVDILGNALRYAKTRIVSKLLMEHGLKEVLNQRTSFGSTPLIEGIFSAHSEDDIVKNVRLLLNAGADPNLANEDGGKPLGAARARGLARVVRLLERYGAKD